MSKLERLQKLLLDHNQLKAIDLQGNHHLKVLSINSNPMEPISYLPQSIVFLAVDKAALNNYNSNNLPNIKQIADSY